MATIYQECERVRKLVNEKISEHNLPMDAVTRIVGVSNPGAFLSGEQMVYPKTLAKFRDALNSGAFDKFKRQVRTTSQLPPTVKTIQLLEEISAKLSSILGAVEERFTQPRGDTTQVEDRAQ